MQTQRMYELLKQKMQEEGLRDVLFVWDTRFSPLQTSTRTPYTVILCIERQQAEIRCYDEFGSRVSSRICLTEEEAIDQTLQAVRIASRQLDAWQEGIRSAAKTNKKNK